MKTTEFHTGQKVTIFRRYPDQYFCINDKVGQIGTILNMCYYPDTDIHFAEVQLEDGSSEWFPAQMLERTPTLDQIKVGTRIQVTEHNRYIDADYAGAYGTITKPYYGVDINVDMLPDDPALRDEWGTITLSGLNRFRILEQSPERLTKTFDKVSVYIEVWSSKSNGISHKLEFEWCDGMKSSTLRDQINIFIDKMEKM